MGEQSRSRGSRRRLAALRWIVLASAACFAGQIDAAGGVDSGVKATASDVPPSVVGSPILTVIVTRHGVRSFSSTPHNYDWPSWREVEPSFLTKRGYDLMKQMGVFYAGLHPAACKDKAAFVTPTRINARSTQLRHSSKEFATREGRFRSITSRTLKPKTRSSTPSRGWLRRAALTPLSPKTPSWAPRANRFRWFS
jgi:hypothetical protein